MLIFLELNLIAVFDFLPFTFTGVALTLMVFFTLDQVFKMAGAVSFCTLLCFLKFSLSWLNLCPLNGFNMQCFTGEALLEQT